jgi:CubicO group peptidase (beta-lactamase class C family)
MTGRFISAIARCGSHLRDQLCGLLLCGFVFTGTAIAADTPGSRDPDFTKIDAYIGSLFDRSGLPGMAVAIVRNDRTAYFRGFGEARRGSPVKQSTLFILGSTTKSFTALATLQLVDAGKLRLDDPVGRVLPGFLHGAQVAERVTIRSLLNQTSGLSHAAGDQPVWSAGETGPDAVRNWVAGLDASALNRLPGSYEYSNANYVVLGALIERASGLSYATYMRQHVFVPLHMNDSHASLSDVDTRRLASGHKKFLGANFESDLPYPTSFVPGGFIISSAEDLEKYIAAQLPGSPNVGALGLSAASLALWHQGSAAMDREGTKHYAMGWMVGTFNGVPVVAHPGDTGVFSSEFVLVPKENWGVIVLADGSGWLSSQYVHEIASGIVSKLVGREPRDDTRVHYIVLAIYCAVLAVPFVQGFALWRWRKRKASSWLGRLWPVGMHIGAALALILIFPRALFDIPFIELLVSFPDMGYAAVCSGVLALVAFVLALRRRL